MIGLLVLGVVVVLALYVVGLYNSLVRSRNEVKNAFSQIDVQLKRRYDLIPNLVETAKGYLKHESQTLEAVIAARNTAMAVQKKVSATPTDGASMRELLGAETALGQTLGRLMMVAEAYPDLKANQNMMQLTEELTSTENKIGFARQAYNDAVMFYNNSREQFPNNLVANQFGFQAAEPWKIENTSERENVRVSFS